MLCVQEPAASQQGIGGTNSLLGVGGFTGRLKGHLDLLFQDDTPICCSSRFCLFGTASTWLWLHNVHGWNSQKKLHTHTRQKVRQPTCGLFFIVRNHLQSDCWLRQFPCFFPVHQSGSRIQLHAQMLHNQGMCSIDCPELRCRCGFDILCVKHWFGLSEVRIFPVGCLWVRFSPLDFGTF